MAGLVCVVGAPRGGACRGAASSGARRRARVSCSLAWAGGVGRVRGPRPWGIPLPSFGARRAASAGLSRGSTEAARGRESARPPLELLAEGGGGGSGGSGETGGSGGGGDGGDEDSRPLAWSEAEKVLAACGLAASSLPADLLAAGNAGLLTRAMLNNYAAAAKGELGGLVERLLRVPYLRNRLMLDRRFFAKIGAEVAIDFVCATFAEVTKRGDEFWDEFEFYLSDIIVGILLDVAIVATLAPVARLKSASDAKGTFKKALAALPSGVFDPSPFGSPYKPWQRLAAFGVIGVNYASFGFVCGLGGQALTNSLLKFRALVDRTYEPKKEMPTAVDSAGVWALFMGVSSNVRYQLVNGLEFAAERSPLRSSVPALNAVSLVLRFTNNIVGGQNFIDMARYFGVQ